MMHQNGTEITENSSRECIVEPVRISNPRSRSNPGFQVILKTNRRQACRNKTKFANRPILCGGRQIKTSSQLAGFETVPRILEPCGRTQGRQHICCHAETVQKDVANISVPQMLISFYQPISSPKEHCKLTYPNPYCKGSPLRTILVMGEWTKIRPSNFEKTISYLLRDLWYLLP